eukprot:scaffold5941_cov125-Isochrysis_galbana.AAC.9
MLRLPHPDMDTTALTRGSCAAPSNEMPAPYEMPAIASRDMSARQPPARASASSSTALTSCMSAGPAMSTWPYESNQPRVCSRRRERGRRAGGEGGREGIERRVGSGKDPSSRGGGWRNAKRTGESAPLVVRRRRHEHRVAAPACHRPLLAKYA